MKLKELLKVKLEENIKKGDTFEYWLENDFIEIFLTTQGTATNFTVNLSEHQLKTWNMSIDEVKNRLIDEKFKLNEVYLNQNKNKKNEFEVCLDGLKELSIQWLNESQSIKL